MREDYHYRAEERRKPGDCRGFWFCNGNNSEERRRAENDEYYAGDGVRDNGQFFMLSASLNSTAPGLCSACGRLSGSRLNLPM